MRPTPLLLGAAVALCAPFVASSTAPAGAQTSLLGQVATGRLQPAIIHVNGITKRAPSFSGGVITTYLDAARSQRQVSGIHSNVSSPTIGSLGCSTRPTPGLYGTRVNQDCTYRRQAEELIASNPVAPTNLIAGQNDSRIGYNKCGFDYSYNSGNSWGDGIPPFYQHTNDPSSDGQNTIGGGAGTLHIYDAASDPAVTFDSAGRAFYSCVLFDINDNGSGLLVTRSDTGGSFYNNVPDGSNQYVVDEENGPEYSLDKEFIAADSYPNSRNRDNVYIVFTVFNSDPRCTPDPSTGAYGYCSSPIFFSRSTDHANTWSKPVEISGDNPALCSFGNYFDPTRSYSACDFDQGADIQVQPDGTVAVVFNNGNTTTVNSQQLAVVSHDGGLTFSPPSFVGNDVTNGEPLCSNGRNCIPGQGARTDDFPRLAVDRTSGRLYATWQDYRLGKYSIVVNQSDNGVNWSPETVLAPSAADGQDDSQPAIAASPTNHDVAISYYRTPRVTNENTTYPEDNAPGFAALNSDYIAAYAHPTTGAGTQAFNSPFTTQLTTHPFPAPDGNQAGFIGDYSGITFIGSIAHPIWAATADPVPASLQPQGVINDEDVFSGSVPTR